MVPVESLLTLPEYIQIVIATGYIGYSVAKSGLRDKERKDELLYGVIVYGLFGYIAYDLFKSHFTYFFFPAIFATVFSVMIACLWRKFGKPLSNFFLQKAGVLNEDGTPSVWVGLTQATHVGPTQMSVRLKDGSILNCDDVQSFRNAPFPKYYTDNDMNIALYVTSSKSPDGVKEDHPTVRDETWGDRLTYVPASEISRVQVRIKKK